MSVSTVIKALKIAIMALRDKKTRKKIIIIVLTPVFVIFLLFSVLIYIITSPLDVLLKGGIDIYSLAKFKKSEAVLQYSAKDNYSSLNYTKSKIKQNNTDIVYYNQMDKPWNTMLYGTLRTIGTSGCGPTSMAIVISTFTKKDVTPAETADWSYKNGYLVQGYNNGNAYAMSSHALIPALADAYGLQCSGISKNRDTADKIREALSEGKLIVAIMGPGHFTSGGHFIVLSGLTDDGKIIVADCASRQRTDQTWDIDTIINEAKGSAGAGGPFWAISN